MPNWCYNKLYVYGNEVASFKHAVKGYPPLYKGDKMDEKSGRIESEFTFNSLVPVPEDILSQGYDHAGYQWQVEHWGTKWDVYEFRFHEPSTKELIYHFETAWNAPIAWVKRASEKLPELVFSLSFHEESMAFAGRVKFQNGDSLVEEITTDYAEQVSFLEEKFGIIMHPEEE